MTIRPRSDHPVERADAATGFGDHTTLVADLTRALEQSRSCVLAVFSLAGSETHRTEFGERANDELVARLARRFAHVLGRKATCYRPRRDEFCALIDVGADEAASILFAAEKALGKAGKSAAVNARFGAAFLPDDADDAIELLILADENLRTRCAGHPQRERRKTPRPVRD